MKNQHQIAKKNQKSNYIHQEKLLQARAIFNLKFNLLRVSIIASFASILLIYSGRVPVEKVEVAQEIICRIVLVTFKVTKDINENKDE